MPLEQLCVAGLQRRVAVLSAANWEMHRAETFFPRSYHALKFFNVCRIWLLAFSRKAKGKWWPAAHLKPGTRAQAEPSKAVVRSVEWHPDGQVLLTAGLDKRLRFFQARRVASRNVFMGGRFFSGFLDVRRLVDNAFGPNIVGWIRWQRGRVRHEQSALRCLYFASRSAALSSYCIIQRRDRQGSRVYSGLLPGQVDGVRNPKVQSIFLDDMPIHQAAFASGGSHVRPARYRHHGAAHRTLAGLLS